MHLGRVCISDMYDRCTSMIEMHKISQRGKKIETENEIEMNVVIRRSDDKKRRKTRRNFAITFVLSHRIRMQQWKLQFSK